jgi:hypothetical protein
MRKSTTLLLGLAVLATALTAYALEGENGYSEALLFTSSGVQDAVTYAGPYTERWQDLNLFELWAPIGPGQRDGIAANGAGDVFFLVRGRDSTDGDDPIYTGLLKADGSGYTHLVQDVMDSGLYLTREGAELQSVHVSPSGEGLLTSGGPVILRHVISGQGEARTLSVDVVAVDPDDGSETPIFSLGLEAQQAVLAVGGNGTVYVGPMTDGSIAKLTYSGGAYAKSYVPGSFAAGVALTAGPDGKLYTFASTETWSSATRNEKTIYRVDPTTGAASVHAYIAGWNIPYDWVWDSSGKLFVGLVDSKRKYVTPVLEGETTSYRRMISSSDRAPWSLGAGAEGKLHVLEDAMFATGQVWELTPGSGGGGKPPKKPKR